MVLQPGTRLGSYEIKGPLGAGGMGEVYRAFDTTLERPVAIKVLSEADERARGKLLAEARAASALSHPNIATVFEVGEAVPSGGSTAHRAQPYIVMELVDGQPLGELIPSDGLPAESVVRYGLQIADGLAHAHEKGVIHRDLKSQNVVITPEGRAKILDFGLAMRLERQDVEAVTVSMDSASDVGRMVGTLAYMAPEVLRGEEAGARSDVWALGVLLYEMAAGRLPFQGATRTDVVSAIVKEAPNPLSDRVSPGLRSIVEHCLTKEPARRYAHASAIQAALETIQSDAAPPPTAHTPPRSRAWRLAVGVALAVVAVALGYYLRRDEAGAPDLLRLANPTQVSSAIGVEAYASWSPDGRRLAFESNQSGNPDIWVVQIGGQPPVNFTADHSGIDSRPSWSPDGTQIAFLSNRDGLGYYTMSALGGPATKAIALEVSPPHRPQWSPDGSELAGTVEGDGTTFISVLSLRTFETRRVELPNADFGHDLSWSPGGQFFAFVEAVAYNAEVGQLWILRLKDGSMIPLTDDSAAVWSPTWSPDERTLYFVTNRGGSMDLWQQSLAADGSPLGPSQAVTTGIGVSHAAMAPDGSKMAYARGSRAANVWRVPILTDRVATWDDAEQVTFDQALIELLDLSPDGERLIVSSDRTGNHDLWELPSAGGVMRQLTTDPTPDWGPRVSPDGERIAFYSYRSGNRDLWLMPVGGGAARQLTDHAADDAAPTWSPDGQYVAFGSLRSGNWDVWVVPASGGEPRQLTTHPATDSLPSWSPDGRWVGFGSLREGPGVWRMPAAGGTEELVAANAFLVLDWSPDGQALYVARVDGLWEVSVDGSRERQVMDLGGRLGSLVVPGSAASDGRYIYFPWRVNEADIWVMDVLENGS